MRLFGRREVPPPDVVAQLPPDDRVVSWADVVGGGVVIATPSGLWWPDDGAHRRIGWQHITKAVWQDGVLSVIEADVQDELLLVDRAPIAAAFEVPRDLPPVVRKRIETNVVRSELMPVSGGNARLVGRRIPGRDGVQWWARLEDGTPDSEPVRSAVREALAVFRAEYEAANR